MEVKSVNQKLGQYQITEKLVCSESTLQRYRHDKNIFSTYRITPNSQKRKLKTSKTNLDDNSSREHDFKKHQMTSKDLKSSQKIEFDSAVNRTTNNESKLKGGVNIEINDEFLEEILHNNIFSCK